MFTGSYVALVTPFSNGRIDVGKLEELVEYHVEAGTNGLVPCGTTGESATLTSDEHELVIGTVVKKADGRIPVLAGTGSNSTQEALDFTKFAQDCGADGALLITPYYNKPTQDGLIAHFETVAEGTQIPIVLYNVPSRTAVNMTAETVIKVSQMPTVIGIKEASGDLEQAVDILRGAPDLILLSGDDGLTLPLMAIGGRGVISVAANIVPKSMVDLVDLASEGDFAGAREIHYRLHELFKTLFLETNPIPVKAAMVMRGMIGHEIRMPMTEITEENRRKLQAVLDESPKN